MRPASVAYPRVANRTYLKYVGIAAIVVFVVALFLSDDDQDVRKEEPASGDGTDGNLRGEVPGHAKLSQLLAVGLGLTEQAALVIKEVKRSGAEELKVKGYTQEGVEEPVTVADTMSNKVFVNGYRNHFDGIQMLSEETEPNKDDSKVESLDLPTGWQLGYDPDLDLSKVLVIVDPLDATKEFGEDLLNYVTTMVCVVHDGVPIAGIINQVFEDDKPPVVGVIPLEGANGALFNREKKAPVAEEAAHTVTISRSHTGEGGNVIEKYLEGHQVLLAGGAGYKTLLVLDGNAEAYVHVTAIKSWDVCAAEAVTKASGGGFSDIQGNALVYSSNHDNAKFVNGIIATASKEQQQFFVDQLDGRLT